MDTTLPALKKFRGRHFLTDLDYTREELEDLLKLAVNLKALWKKRPLTPFLPGKHLAMIFEAASTRTRVSFENGFAELGGNALYLRPGEIHLPGRESIADTARTLSQYNAAIEIRSKKNETVNELAAVVDRAGHQRHGPRPAPLPEHERRAHHPRERGHAEPASRSPTSATPPTPATPSRPR